MSSRVNITRLKRNNIITQHVFIIGCKGIPAQYGGFGTFVDKLTQYRSVDCIQYHVACALESDKYDSNSVEFKHKSERILSYFKRENARESYRYFVESAMKKNEIEKGE